MVGSSTLLKEVFQIFIIFHLKADLILFFLSFIVGVSFYLKVKLWWEVWVEPSYDCFNVIQSKSKAWWNDDRSNMYLLCNNIRDLKPLRKAELYFYIDPEKKDL